jgi:oligopeptide/dipeptide ABC transporter ATP-binding protein
MGVVAEIADAVAVMYGGRIVEQGAVADVFESPAHPYTQALLASAQDGADAPPKTPFAAIGGSPPSGTNPPGCPFHPRCPQAHDPCSSTMPPVTEAGFGHAVACHLYGGER